MNAHAKHALDYASALTMLGALFSWLPSIAALFTIVWTGLRIYETKTIQKWIHRK